MGKSTKHTILDNFCSKWPPQSVSSLLCTPYWRKIKLELQCLQRSLIPSNDKEFMCKKYAIFFPQQTTSPKQQISQSTVGLFQTGFTALFRQWFKENEMQSFIKLANSALIQKKTFVTAFTGIQEPNLFCSSTSRPWNRLLCTKEQNLKLEVLQRDNTDTFTTTNN